MRVGVVVCRDTLWVFCVVIRVLKVLSSSVFSFAAVLFPKSMAKAQTNYSELILHTDGGQSVHEQKQLKYDGITVETMLGGHFSRGGQDWSSS